MSYNSNIPQQKYVASAGQTVFPFLFKIFQEADLTVYKVTEGDDPEAALPLTLNVDYTVIINGDLGGSVTLTVGASDGASVTIYRRLNIVRYVEYQTSGDLLAATLNADQDYQTYLTADLADAVKEELSGAAPGEPIGEYVRRTGDTMTGNLEAPSITIGGYPVGIESGSNVNGNYTKFPDGTLICTNSISGFIANNASGALFNSDPKTWNFPSTFTANAVVSADGGSSAQVWASTTTGTTSSTIRAWAAVSQTTEVLYVMAIGRWK